MLQFDYDPRKSLSNLEKHGIDFKDAQGIWGDPRAIEVPARTLEEPRYLVIGRFGDAHWSAVITYRQNTIRIISVRRSRTEEIALYESAQF